MLVMQKLNPLTQYLTTGVLLGIIHTFYWFNNRDFLCSLFFVDTTFVQETVGKWDLVFEGFST